MNPTFPQQFKYLFWEFDINTLDLERHAEFVIDRVLEKGSIADIVVLFKVYSRKTIKEAIQKSKNLTTPTINIWNLYFNG